MAPVALYGRPRPRREVSVTPSTEWLLSATEETDDLLKLGEPTDEKSFSFLRGHQYDPHAVATQPSVFDDPITAEHYHPPLGWENYHRFDPLARWTWREEYQILRKIDLRIMIFACIMFVALELDRANLSQAVTDNFLGDLGLDTNDFNYGYTIFRFSFLLAELPSQLLSKWLGPDRWIPTQMVLWSTVAAAQFWLSGRGSFLACRALLGFLQGGFIADMILYLSYFYKHSELSLRLGVWWAAISIADAVAAVLGFGILRLRGHLGYAGWRWLFLIDGLLTFSIGCVAYVLMPPGPCETASWTRGKHGWFTEREEIIMVNRVIRDDPSKSTMHNREPITLKLLSQSITDYDLWPLYILGLTFQTPMSTPSQYLTLSLRGMGFGTCITNLLVIPTTIGHVTNMLLVTYMSEFFNQRWIFGLLAQLWALPFLVYLYTIDINAINKWTAFATMTIFLSYPSVHAIQVGWNSRNSNSVRTRTVSAALYNMACQTSGIIASNIYREDDRPRYLRGNRILLSLCLSNIALYILAKVYYTLRNRHRENIWSAMSPEKRSEYLHTTEDEGNKRLDFRFAT